LQNSNGTELVLCIGSNDVAARLDDLGDPVLAAAAVLADIKKVIGAVRSGLPNMTVSLVDLFRRETDNTQMKQTRLLVNSGLPKTLADRFVRASASIKKHHIDKDGVHLTKLGKTKLQNALSSNLAPKKTSSRVVVGTAEGFKITIS
jgi:lysophospholipase L1-like esterase